MTPDELLFEQEQIACVVARGYPHLNATDIFREALLDLLRCAIQDGVITTYQIAELITTDKK